MYTHRSKIQERPELPPVPYDPVVFYLLWNLWNNHPFLGHVITCRRFTPITWTFVDVGTIKGDTVSVRFCCSDMLSWRSATCDSSSSVSSSSPPTSPPSEDLYLNFSSLSWSQNAWMTPWRYSCKCLRLVFECEINYLINSLGSSSGFYWHSKQISGPPLCPY